MASPMHPLIASPDEQPSEFSGMDATVIDFPDKVSPLEEAYHQTADLHPEQAAAVVRMTDATKQPPEFVAENLEAAQKAASIPASEYFSQITKQYPQTADYLSDPKNMAVAKDDIHALGRTEELVRGFSTTRTLWNSLNVGMARLNEQVARIPATVYDLAAFPQNLIARSVGRPDLEVQSPEWLANNPVAKYYAEAAKAWSPPVLSESVTDLLKNGRLAEAGTALTAQFIESAPSLALLIGASAAGYPGAGSAGIGLTSAGEALKRNRAMGVDPASASLNALYHGAINTAFMNLGALNPLHRWEAAIAESVGRDTASKVILDMVKTLAGSASSMGGTMAAITASTDLADYATGVNPDAMRGSWKRALDAAIVGGATGAALVGPTAILGGFARATEVQRTQQAKDFYLALGDSAESSKLRERLPDAHRDLVEKITQNGPVDSIYTPVSDFEAYFQDKKLDPRTVAEELGVGAQFDQAKEAGGDLRIPLSTWTERIVGTEHYKGLADDVKFFQEDLTPRQAAARTEMVGKMAEAEAAAAQKDDPKLKEGRDIVYNDIKTKLQNAGRPAKEADAAAQIWAARSVVEAKKRGISPEAWYNGEHFQVSKQAATEPDIDLKLPDVMRQGPLDEYFSKTVDDIVTGRRIPRHPIPVSRTPAILRWLGAKDLPLTTDADVITKAREKHQISVESIKQLGNEIRDPLMIFDSATQPNAMVVLTTLQDTQGAPVVAAIHLERSEQRYTVNKVASMHGREVEQIGNWIEKGLTRYWDQENATPWLQSAGLQLPGEGVKASTKSIRSKVEFVNELKPSGNKDVFEQGQQNDLPVVSEQAKTGEPHAVFVYNWKLSADRPAIPYFRLYGDPEKINQMTQTAENPKGNAWRSDVSLETVKAAGIEIRGRAPDAREQPLYQDPTDPRGFIQFTPKETLIGLVKADASTFMHESAHFWLKDMFEYVRSGIADEKYLGDWKRLSDWLKVEDGQKDLTRDQHEQFARGFEAYLREGKAPSESLRRPFALFRKWLTRLYKDPAMLNVQLSDDVRGVMDRMFASEEEIAFAEKQAGFDLGKDLVDLPPEVQAHIQDLADRAHETAISTLMTKQMQEMSAEHQAMLARERTNAQLDAEKAVRESPIQSAMAALGKTLGGDPLKVAQDYWLGNLPEDRRATFDQLAESRGFTGGDELAKKIIDELPAERQVADLVRTKMAEFADLRHSDRIKDEALKAIHNDKMAELMAFERAAFQRLVMDASGKAIVRKSLATEARLEAATAKIKAREIIASKSVRDAGSYLSYFTAERNAAAEVAKALTEKNFAGAADAKRRQMLNHALVSESHQANIEIQKALRFFDRFASRGQDLKGVPYGFMRQIDTLLADRGLAKPRPDDPRTYLAIAEELATKGEDPAEIAHQTGWMQDPEGDWRPEHLSDTIARIQEDYRDISIPESVLNAKAQNLRQMSFADLMDLKMAVRSLNAVGRGYDRFLDENIKMDRKEAAAKLREYVEQNIGKSYLEARDIGQKADQTIIGKGVETITHLPDAAIPSLVNLLSITDVLDAKKPDGLMKMLTYRPLMHAEETKAGMVNKAVDDVNALLTQHFAKGEYEKLRKENVYIRSRDRAMTRDEILAFALNWGNPHGRQRLVDGYQLTEQQLGEILSNVPKNHWEFAQAIWNYFDSYWPKIVALQQKVAGETPEKVKSAPVETQFGAYPGGYYPLAYDPRKTNDAARSLDARNALYKTLGSVSAHTDHGFTKSRVQNYTGPVRLDSRVLFDHLEDLIHDLTFRQAVVDVNGFLRQKDAREAITNALGIDALKAIQTHLKWVASQQVQPLNGADAIIRKLRMGATIATLGLRPLQAPLSAGGNILNAMHEIGPVRFASSIREFLGDKETNTQFVNQRSYLMSERATVRDRDLSDLANRWSAKDSLFKHYTFYMDSLSDQAVSFPLWLNVYRGAVGEHGEQTAVDLANEAVIKTMGSGRVLDQANIQRGSESQKLFSWWYSWSGMMFNRMWREGKFAGLEYQKGNVGTALAITANAGLYGWLLQSANENFWRELFRNTQNLDEDKRAKRVMLRSIMQPISYVPIYRDIAQAALYKIAGQPSGGFTVPFQDAVQTMTNPIAEMGNAAIADKDMSPRFWEDTARLAAVVAKYPQIINTWAFNFIDYLNEDGDLTWRDLVSRRTKS